ncbi:hypothetical protein DFR29_10516 [Tahibacter aquaticus]|uniref:Transmembrane protein n=1 Tax=Tahibacter aquaticus TaxID=520092 RepID=A0A4R6Z007_9GAMM|nr:hypothetical protein [Tahibacter aquaticus]TDR44835.1 hypothetical protein DFR29_10516 [Tahibacter aquaticus]
MQQPLTETAPYAPRLAERGQLPAIANPGAVSWGAVLAGAAGAASLSLILAFLGFGLGMSSISPWAGSGASVEALGVGSIVWITLTQIAAAALGGYLAGRLRTRWLNTHSDEVYFRDTAHGFLAWSVATLATAALFVSAIGAIASGGAKIGAAAVAGGSGAAAAMAADVAGRPDNNQAYLLDSLFRPGPNAPAAAGPVPNEPPGHANAESARIFVNAVRAGSLNAEDTRYLGQVVANRTGLSAAEGEARVRRAYAQWEQGIATAKDAADKARKATAWGALWLFISLLGGAFFASYAATWGGKRRDLID